LDEINFRTTSYADNNSKRQLSISPQKYNYLPFISKKFVLLQVYLSSDNSRGQDSIMGRVIENLNLLVDGIKCREHGGTQ
jgi:hypothetical protein